MSNKSKGLTGSTNTKFQTGYNSTMEPRPIMLIFQRGNNTAESSWTVEDAAAMAAGLLKFIEIAKRERAKRAVIMPQ